MWVKTYDPDMCKIGRVWSQLLYNEILDKWAAFSAHFYGELDFIYVQRLFLQFITGKRERKDNPFYLYLPMSGVQTSEFQQFYATK